jgi:hypothetical protein
LPEVPWLCAFVAFVLGAPPVPVMVAPFVSVVPVPELDDRPPVDATGDPPEEPLAPDAVPPELPAPAPPAESAAPNRAVQTNAVTIFIGVLPDRETKLRKS